MHSHRHDVLQDLTRPRGQLLCSGAPRRAIASINRSSDIGRKNQKLVHAPDASSNRPVCGFADHGGFMINAVVALALGGFLSFKGYRRG
jgi:hypothetical protein